jgi:hypothetical protein
MMPRSPILSIPPRCSSSPPMCHRRCGFTMVNTLRYLSKRQIAPATRQFHSEYCVVGGPVTVVKSLHPWGYLPRLVYSSIHFPPTIRPSSPSSQPNFDLIRISCTFQDLIKTHTLLAHSFPPSAISAPTCAHHLYCPTG